MGGVKKTLDAHMKLAYDFMMTQINIDQEKWERSKALHAERQKRYMQNKKMTSADASPFKEIDKVEDKVESTTSFVGSVENSGKAAIGISDTANSQKEAAAGPKDLEFFERVFKPYVNNIIRDSNIPPIKRLSKLRLEKLRVLLKDFTTKDIATVCQKAASSNFLNYGGTKHKFQATFDWLIEPENFLKVLEGTYR